MKTEELENAQNPQQDGGAPEEEKPQIYSVKKGGENFKFSRKDFLVTAAAAAGTVAFIGVGMGAVGSSSTGQSSAPAGSSDEVSLKTEMIGSVVAPLGQSFAWLWRLTNTGAAPCSDASLHLYVEGKPELEKTVEIPKIIPGAAVEVPVELAGLPQAGEVIYNWETRFTGGASKARQLSLKAMDWSLAETPHPYENESDQTWTLTNPDESAQYTQIRFFPLSVEEPTDYVIVMDGSGNEVQRITGSHPSPLWTNPVPGRVVTIRFLSDSSITEWGFVVDQIQTHAVIYQLFMPLIFRPLPTPTTIPCACNQVCTCDTVCSCVSYCSCNEVCTCDTVCSCVRNHYWYPN